MITPTTTARNIERLNITHATVFVVDPPGPGPRVADKLAVKLEPNVKKVIGDKKQYVINCSRHHRLCLYTALVVLNTSVATPVSHSLCPI